MMKARDDSVIDLGISSHKLPHCCFALIALLLLLLVILIVIDRGVYLVSFLSLVLPHPPNTLLPVPRRFPLIHIACSAARHSPGEPRSNKPRVPFLLVLCLRRRDVMLVSVQF